MLKKYKILALMSLLSLLGITGIIGLWLYDSYLSRREIVIADVERSLFNAIQTYYQDHQGEISNNRQAYYRREQSSFLKELEKRMPNLDKEAIYSVWDSLAIERKKRNERRERRERDEDHREPTMLIPSFMLQSIDFNSETIAEIENHVSASLQSKGLNVAVKIELKELVDRPKHGYRMKIEVQPDGTMVTRPVLVNPSKNEFLIARFEQPIWFVLTKMLFQIIASVVLFAALLGTFFYLIYVINKQVKLAELRKSFVNNMTHELKTPVATVMAAVESVQRYGAKDDKVRMAKYLDISHKELTHLAGMIERVLEFDVDEEKGLILNKTEVNVVDLLRTSAESARLGAKKDVEITVHSVDETILMNIDESHIRNVFTNLIDNAIKYSTDAIKIDIGVESIGDSVFIDVKDNGIGIDSMYHKDIFDMFFRVPSGNLHAVKGFGLGLSYVKQVLDKHQGQIKVSSKLGHGTTFRIIIPK